MDNHSDTPTSLTNDQATLWARHVAAELAAWGHGTLAPDPHSGGVAISGLANKRGCCASPTQIQGCAGTIAQQTPLGHHTTCLACLRPLAISAWTSWDGPGAAAVRQILVSSPPASLDPPDIAEDRAGPDRRRGRRSRHLPASPSPRKMRRADAAFVAAGLPVPLAAVQAAEQGRGAAQSILAAGAAGRCDVLLESLGRRGDTIDELPAGAVAPLRVGTDETHGLTLWEPELIVDDTLGLVTAAYLQPLTVQGQPVAPADELPAPDADPRRARSDEHRWPHDVTSQPAGTIHDADPVALTLRCIPVPFLKASVRSPRDSRSLPELWAQALSGSFNGSNQPPTHTAPRWLCDETVENRLRNVLAAVVRRPSHHAPPPSRGLLR